MRSDDNYTDYRVFDERDLMIITLIAEPFLNCEVEKICRPDKKGALITRQPHHLSPFTLQISSPSSTFKQAFSPWEPHCYIHECGLQDTWDDLEEYEERPTS